MQWLLRTGPQASTKRTLPPREELTRYFSVVRCQCLSDRQCYLIAKSVTVERWESEVVFEQPHEARNLTAPDGEPLNDTFRTKFELNAIVRSGRAAVNTLKSV